MRRGREGAAKRKMGRTAVETRERFSTDTRGRIMQEESIRTDAHKQEEDCVK